MSELRYRRILIDYEVQKYSTVLCVCVRVCLHKDELLWWTTGSGQPHRLHWSKWVAVGELDHESFSSFVFYSVPGDKK